MGESILQSIYEGYRLHSEKERKLEASIEKNEQKLKRLQRQGGWYQQCVVPLAKQLSQALAMPHRIYGPYGLGATTTIYFFPRKKAGNITKDENYSITLHPATRNHYNWQLHFDETFYFTYDTGEKKEEYAPGTLGAMNGFNNVEAELPDDLNAIMEIVKSHHYVPQKEEKQ